MAIENALTYLNRKNYSVVYEELQKSLREVQVQIPQMGEKDEKQIQTFQGAIRDFFYRRLNITGQAGSASTEVRDAVEIAVLDMQDMIRGYGPLQAFMNMDGVEEIIVRNGSILLELGGQIKVAVDNSENKAERATIGEQFSILAARIADLGQTPLSETVPFAVTTVPETLDRCGVIRSPLSHTGTAINIRVFPRKEPLTMERLQERLAFATKEEIETAYRLDSENERLKRAYNNTESIYRAGQDVNLFSMLDKIEDEEARKKFEILANQLGAKTAVFLAYTAWRNLSSVMVAGEFSSGKTTLLNAMSYFIRNDVQPVALEEFYELRIPHKYILRCVTGKTFDQSQILNMVLTRMRPDIIIVGELVSKEAFEFLNAANLGKKAWATIHSNDARSALLRLENIATKEGFSAFEIRRRVANGMDMVVHLAVEAGDRFINEIVVVGKELDNGEYVTRQIHSSKRRGQRLDQLEALWAGMSESNLSNYRTDHPIGRRGSKTAKIK